MTSTRTSERMENTTLSHLDEGLYLSTRISETKNGVIVHSPSNTVIRSKVLQFERGDQFRHRCTPKWWRFEVSGVHGVGMALLMHSLTESRNVFEDVLCFLYLSITSYLVFGNRLVSSRNELFSPTSCLTDFFIAFITAAWSVTFLYGFDFHSLYSSDRTRALFSQTLDWRPHTRYTAKSATTRLDVRFY